MFFPGAAFYMEKIAVGPEGIDAVDINASPTENVAGREGEGHPRTRPGRRRARARPPQGADRGAPRGGREGAPHPRRRRRAVDRSGPGRDRGRHALRDRRDARRRHLGRGAQVRRRRRSRGSSGRGTTRSAQELVDAGVDPDRVLKTDDLVSGDDVFVAATGVTTGALLRGVRYRRTARHRLDRHALALGDRCG